eukprot:4561246-Pyramimonas_sp.AAC.3
MTVRVSLLGSYGQDSGFKCKRLVRAHVGGWIHTSGDGFTHQGMDSHIRGWIHTSGNGFTHQGMDSRVGLRALTCTMAKAAPMAKT